MPKTTRMMFHLAVLSCDSLWPCGACGMVTWLHLRTNHLWRTIKEIGLLTEDHLPQSMTQPVQLLNQTIHLPTPHISHTTPYPHIMKCNCMMELQSCAEVSQHKCAAAVALNTHKETGWSHVAGAARPKSCAVIYFL